MSEVVRSLVCSPRRSTAICSCSLTNWIKTPPNGPFPFPRRSSLSLSPFISLRVSINSSPRKMLIFSFPLPSVVSTPSNLRLIAGFRPLNLTDNSLFLHFELYKVRVFSEFSSLSVLLNHRVAF